MWERGIETFWKFEIYRTFFELFKNITLKKILKILKKYTVLTVRSGDNIHTASAIARQCGILTQGGIALEGPDFRKMSPSELDAVRTVRDDFIYFFTLSSNFLIFFIFIYYLCVCSCYLGINFGIVLFSKYNVFLFFELIFTTIFSLRLIFFLYLFSFRFYLVYKCWPVLPPKTNSY